MSALIRPSMLDTFPRRRLRTATPAEVRATLRNLWATPRTWTPGELVTALMMNQNVRDNPAALRGGGISLTSQTALDLMYAIDGSSWGRIPVGSPLTNLRVNAGGTGYEFVPGSGVSLVHSGSGTNTSVSAANVDTAAITGLTAKDRLVVVAVMGATGGTAATPSLFNNTDSVTIIADGSNVTTGTAMAFGAQIQQRQTAGTAIIAFGNMAATSVTNDTMKTQTATFTTAWTGNWTLALRHGGVSGGGTVDYSWSVYKWVGQ